MWGQCGQSMPWKHESGAGCSELNGTNSIQLVTEVQAVLGNQDVDKDNGKQDECETNRLNRLLVISEIVKI